MFYLIQTLKIRKLILFYKAVDKTNRKLCASLVVSETSILYKEKTMKKKDRKKAPLVGKNKLLVGKKRPTRRKRKTGRREKDLVVGKERPTRRQKDLVGKKDLFV